MKRYKLSKTAKEILEKVKCANFIFYILELNKFNEKEIREVFNKVLKMYKDKKRGDFF